MVVPRIQVVSAASVARQRRKPRRPQHTFNLKSKAFELVPFMCAPVLPGESITNILMQSRAVSDPVKNPLIGWWKEYYFYYIPLPALADPLLGGGSWSLDQLTGFVLDPTVNLATINPAVANYPQYYEFKGGARFVSELLYYVMNKDFRDEDDLGQNHTVDLYPAVYIDQNNWAQSLKKESATGDDMELPGVDELEELDILPGFTTNYAQWEIMRDNGLTDATYADFLKSYGVSTNAADEVGSTAAFPFKGELIRYVRQWQYPTNHIEPTTGAPTSALSWSIAERADKVRFCKHPGFIFGVTCTRPKIYLGSQKGSASGLLRDAYSWLPAILRGQPYTTVQENLDSATDGILQNQSEDYWLDLKDLFLRGDQFVNFAMDAAANHGIAMPTAALDKRVVTEAMVDSLFVTVGSEYIREDGVVHLDVLSSIGPDTTPG